MARSADQVLDGVLGLLPEGLALPRERDSRFAALLRAPAAELARVEMRAEALLVEADPRATVELLPEWERMAGMPDPCAPNFALDGTPLATLAQRQLRLAQRVTGQPGARPADYIALAASLGITVTITEYREHTCEAGCVTPVYGPDWRFAWTVNGPATPVTDTTVEDGCELPLRSWGIAPLECFIRRQAPPHTTPLFAYS